MINMEVLRKNMRYLRKRSGYTINQFARIVGLSKYTISSVESGYGGISVSVLMKMRDIFNVSIDDLLYKDLEKQTHAKNK